MKVKITQPKFHLTLEETYIVVGIDQDCLRIVNDNGNPVLYPSFLFDIIDDKIPDDWIVSIEEDGKMYCDPPCLSGRDFYVDWFNGVLEARSIFDEFYRELINKC
ncbi:MAG: hypothetical protein JEZ07_04205 [Phycisphaerae bacterium]|nr:hypothetical protein [Phycisphaerae bacterium]